MNDLINKSWQQLTTAGAGRRFDCDSLYSPVSRVSETRIVGTQCNYTSVDHFRFQSKTKSMQGAELNEVATTRHEYFGLGVSVRAYTIIVGTVSIVCVVYVCVETTTTMCLLTDKVTVMQRWGSKKELKGYP